MRESKLERDSTDLAESLLWVPYKGFGRNGASDKIYLKAGRGFTIEFKIDRGVESKVQEHEAAHLGRRGVPRYVVRNLEDMKRALLIEESKLTENDLLTMRVSN